MITFVKYPTQACRRIIKNDIEPVFGLWQLLVEKFDAGANLSICRKTGLCKSWADTSYYDEMPAEKMFERLATHCNSPVRLHSYDINAVKSEQERNLIFPVYWEDEERINLQMYGNFHKRLEDVQCVSYIKWPTGDPVRQSLDERGKAWESIVKARGQDAHLKKIGDCYVAQGCVVESLAKIAQSSNLDSGISPWDVTIKELAGCVYYYCPIVTEIGKEITYSFRTRLTAKGSKSESLDGISACPPVLSKQLVMQYRLYASKLYVARLNMPMHLPNTWECVSRIDRGASCLDERILKVWKKLQHIYGHSAFLEFGEVGISYGGYDELHVVKDWQEAGIKLGLKRKWLLPSLVIGGVAAAIIKAIS